MEGGGVDPYTVSLHVNMATPMFRRPIFVRRELPEFEMNSLISSSGGHKYIIAVSYDDNNIRFLILKGNQDPRHRTYQSHFDFYFTWEQICEKLGLIGEERLKIREFRMSGKDGYGLLIGSIDGKGPIKIYRLDLDFVSENEINVSILPLERHPEKTNGVLLFQNDGTLINSFPKQRSLMRIVNCHEPDISFFNVKMGEINGTQARYFRAFDVWSMVFLESNGALMIRNSAGVNGFDPKKDSFFRIEKFCTDDKHIPVVLLIPEYRTGVAASECLCAISPQGDKICLVRIDKDIKGQGEIHDISGLPIKGHVTSGCFDPEFLEFYFCTSENEFLAVPTRKAYEKPDGSHRAFMKKKIKVGNVKNSFSLTLAQIMEIPNLSMEYAKLPFPNEFEIELDEEIVGIIKVVTDQWTPHSPLDVARMAEIAKKMGMDNWIPKIVAKIKW